MVSSRVICAIVAMCMAAVTPLKADPVQVGALSWNGDIGGLSGIDVADNGRDFVILNDRGFVHVGAFARDENDMLTGIAKVQKKRLRALSGWPHTADSNLSDSEGITFSQDGSIVVSYEKTMRVERHKRDGHFIQRLSHVLLHRKVPHNMGLEALAEGPDGRIYTMPEGGYDDVIPILRYDGEHWQEVMRIPRDSQYRPTGADFGPAGRLYILERGFFGPLFTTRVRRLDLQDGSEKIVLQTPLGRHSNLEGIAVWRDAQGYIRLTMVADNNNLSWLPGGVVEYRLSN